MGKLIEHRRDDDNGMRDFLRVLLAVFLPPVAVFLEVGFGLQFWINVLLTILGYLPGMIHAVWIIVRR
ncbi:Uncharacterized membrane protein YqaE, homolog of Blt101, UPF0057 family [Filomicrobium insigne]|uniref:Uncharacterized membrane protein YqaE, homolog of Blt101, UPF0057 family n=2 Tax=Hyphomicrobiaceae TaxID=45401 RepID=A0A1H0IQI1_9HYPH|nr:Uncharacterized membrane protein YqaE, homolog of Blt101, UPF0057 family [Filomicrobium insigne]